MNEDKIRIGLESVGIDSEQIEEAIISMKEKEREDKIVEEEKKESNIAELEMMIMKEIDWRKRASLIAKKISLGLST